MIRLTFGLDYLIWSAHMFLIDDYLASIESNAMCPHEMDPIQIFGSSQFVGNYNSDCILVRCSWIRTGHFCIYACLKLSLKWSRRVKLQNNMCNRWFSPRSTIWFFASLSKVDLKTNENPTPKDIYNQDLVSWQQR